MEQVREVDTKAENVSTGSSDERSGDFEQDRDETLCALCKERERDYSENSRSVLCKECREEHLKLRIPLGIKLSLVAILASFLVSVFMLPPVLAKYRTYIDAGRNMEARQYDSATTKYMSLLETYSNSIPITIKAS